MSWLYRTAQRFTDTNFWGKRHLRNNPDVSYGLDVFQSPDFPHVFLGGEYELEEAEAKAGQKICKILDCRDLPEVGPMSSWSHSEFSQVQSKFNAKVNELIGYISNLDCPIYVHCALGANRSVSVLASAITKLTGKTLDQVLSEMKSVRSVVRPQDPYYLMALQESPSDPEELKDRMFAELSGGESTELVTSTWHKEFVKLSEQRIKEPYYRITCPACYGQNAGGDPVGPGSYWTPRWNGILEMMKTIMKFYLQSGTMGKLNSDAFKTRIYKIEEAIMDDPPPENAWAFNFQSDVGEQVLVKALSSPELMYDLHPMDEQFQELVTTEYEKEINYASGVKFNWRGQEVFVMPDYNRKIIEVAIPSNGWKFEVIHVIKSMDELDAFYAEATELSDEINILDYFPQDVGWIK